MGVLECREQLRPLNLGGGEAPRAAPILGPGALWPPLPARPGSDRQTRLHIWKACPPGRLSGPHIWKYLLPSVGMEARQPRGRKGRARGPQPPLRKWAADVATARRPQLVWMGPRALGSPGMRFPHRLSPQPLAGPPSVSLSSSLLPLSQPRGPLGGLAGKGSGGHCSGPG